MLQQIGSERTLSRYYSVWATFSTDNGNSWIPPEQITPVSPLKDWRYVSVSPTNNVIGNTWTVQMVCQSDSLAGTHINGAPIGRGELVGISTLPQLILLHFSNIIVSTERFSECFYNNLA
jgi:hypothetical protein